MASVTTYSLISSRRISSSVWSTLMTSSMRRRMSLAKSVPMGWAVVIVESSSEDLRSVVVLGVEHAHETQARRAIEVARVKKHRRDVDAALQLFQQGEGSIHREQRARSKDKDNVA